MRREVTTDAELWDYMAFRLGIEDWDEGAPWWKYRMGEVAKVKRTRVKRRCSLSEVVLCIDYCHRHQIPIHNQSWVYQYLPKARAELRSLETTDLAEQIQHALACERSLAAGKSSPWLARLVNARGEYRRDVLAEWSAAREPLLRSLTAPASTA